MIVLGSDTLPAMAFLKVFLILGFLNCVFSDQILKKHCKTGSEDYATCIVETIQDYFRKHSGGFPEHNLKAVDPIIVPEIIVEDKSGFKATHTNIKVTGFKDVILSDVNFLYSATITVSVTKLNSNRIENMYLVRHLRSYSRYRIVETEGRVEFTMKFDMVAEGDVIAETNKGKTYSGTFKYDGSVKGNSKYNYTEKKVNNDLIIYNAGPETITCEASNVKDHFNQELADSFDNDPDNQAINDEFKKPGYTKEYLERIICKIATVVFKEAIDVLRTIGQKGVE